MLSIIVAVAKNNAIGKDNKLLWHIPDDLKRFKHLTTNKTIIMGRKTFESLNGVLPNRKHVILSRDKDFSVDNKSVEIAYDVEELKKYIESEEEHFVIGGAMIYKLLLPYVNKMYITKVDCEFEADTFFPNYDEKEWEITLLEKGPKNDQNPYDYYYYIYIKK